MRNSGGFILIKIDKALADITTDDFNKKLFREIIEKRIFKPIILQTKENYNILAEGNNSFGVCSFYYTGILLDEGNIDGYTQIKITYELATDTLTFDYDVV